MNIEETAILLSRKAVAKMLSLTPRSVDLLIADGRLKPTRFGRRVLIHRSEVERIALDGIEGSIWPSKSA